MACLCLVLAMSGQAMMRQSHVDSCAFGYAGQRSAAFAAFFRGMTKHDGYFHMLMAGVCLGGFLFMSTAGESMWRSANKGVRRLAAAAACRQWCCCC